MPRQEGPGRQERIKKDPNEAWVKGQISELRMYGAAHEDERAHHGLGTSVTLYKGLVENLEEAQKRQGKAEDPGPFEPLIEEINKRIEHHLRSEVIDLRVIMKSDPANAKERLTIFESHVESLKEPLVKIDERKRDLVELRPSPVQLEKTRMNAVYKDWEQACDALYGLPSEIRGGEDFDQATLPEGVDAVRLAYLRDRAERVLEGVGFFGFHRFDELRSIIEELKKAGMEPALVAPLENIVATIPSAEIENLSREFEPVSQYWKEQTVVPASEKDRRIQERTVLLMMWRKLEGWKKRLLLAPEVLRKWEGMYAEHQRDFGSSFGEDGLRH